MNKDIIRINGKTIVESTTESKGMVKSRPFYTRNQK